MDTKTCIDCQQVLSLDSFHARHSTVKGKIYGPYYESRCKSCQATFRANHYRTKDRPIMAAWRERNREHLNTYAREWRKPNQKRLAAEAVERYYARDGRGRGRIRYHRMKNDPKFRAQRRKAKEARRAEKNGILATLTAEDWLLVLSDFQYRCAYCSSTSELTQDHFIPISKGGHTALGNIVPACKSCNCSKWNRDPHDWLSPELYEELSSILRRYTSRRPIP